ncbi:MAG: hypothetical protein ACYS8I_00365 [Planctomycetota bacterium]
MSDRVFIPLPNGEWLAMSMEAFLQARLDAQSLVLDTTQTPEETTSRLYTAADLEQLTSIPAKWFMTKAREGKLPHIKAGRYVRFDFDAVREAMTNYPNIRYSKKQGIKSVS